MKPNGYGATDTGLKRSRNEDSYLMDDDLGLFVVCDGVGGNSGGDVASKTAVRTFRDAVAKNPAALEKFANDPAPTHRDGAATLIQNAIQEANTQLFAAAEADPNLKGMASTLVTAVVRGRHAFIAHVGDSRAYLLRGGTIHSLTRDHKVASDMVKQGLWTEEDAEQSSFKNVLSRALGTQSLVQCDSLLLELAPGDLLLLCSDGLHGYFEGNALSEIVAKTDLARIPQALINFAREKGGADNITAIVIRMEEAAKEGVAYDALKKSEVLGKVPLFRYLEYAELLQVLNIVKLCEFKKQEVLLQEGAPGDEMHVLLSGKVAVLKGEQIITQRGKGEVFGDMSLFDNAPRSASVRAEEPVVAMKIGRTDLLALLRRNSQIAVKLLWALNQELSSRLRETNQQLASARAQQAPKDQLPF
jgi:serine/threonine protein phosphatase PrpC